jgi:hypothetical protein
MPTVRLVVAIHLVRKGSISEVITLDTPCSGDVRKAESICCLISCVSSSQFGQERLFAPRFQPRNEKKIIN